MDVERGEVRLSRSVLRWELGAAREGRRRVRVRVRLVDLPHAARVEGEWSVDARFVRALRGKLWDECVVEMAKDAMRAAVSSGAWSR
jgi:hypothetical protein